MMNEADKDRAFMRMIRQLSLKQSFSERDKVALCNELLAIYSHEYSHKYALISEALIDESDHASCAFEEKQEILNQNLRILICDERLGEDILRHLRQLYRHCNLELNELASIHRIELQNQWIMADQERLREDLAEIEKPKVKIPEVKRVKRHYFGIFAQPVAVVGVFMVMVASFGLWMM